MSAQTRLEDGVHASNQIFGRYEQVRKDQVYHLAEQGNGEEAFDEDFKFSTCDLSKFLHGDDRARREFARELGEAFEEIGFAILTGHGVDTALYDATFRRIEQFFREVQLEDRLRYRAARHGSVNQGYFPIKETSNAHPDLVEGWVFCRRAFNLDGTMNEADVLRFWPSAAYEAEFRKVVVEHEKLILPLMRALLLHFGAPEDSFDARLTSTNFGFRLNYYPPLTELQDTTGAGRMLGHEDMDLFTILPASPVEGLQVLNRRNMKWIRLHAPPGSIILNVGDYLQRVTNDRLPSTTHRVSRPKDRAQWGLARTSFPMAVYLWEEELLEVIPELRGVKPPYPPIKAVDFHVSAMSKYYGDDYRKTGADK